MYFWHKIKELKINVICAQILIILLITFSNSAFADKGLLVSQDSCATPCDITSDDVDSDAKHPYITFNHELQKPSLRYLAFISSDTSSDIPNRLFNAASIRAPPAS